MKLVFIDRQDNYKAVGMPPQTYVKMYQGGRNTRGHIPHADEALSGERHFLHYTSKPTLTWGSGIFIIKQDGYLLHLESDYDTSP